MTTELKTKELFFYEAPFLLFDACDWVYDNMGNFVFQFEPRFNQMGEYIDGEEELQRAVIESLNSKEHHPIEFLKLNSFNAGEIFNGDLPFITIRGWGNLTGIGAHNFSGKKAANIQDRFQEWIIYKLSKSK